MTQTALLQDQVTIITGGTNGIGKAIALLFAEHKANVVVFGTNQERGQAVVQEGKKYTDTFEFMSVDVSNKSSVETAIKQVSEKFGRLDILVNCAGITKDQLMLRMSEEDWKKVLDVNLNSCFYTCQASLKHFLKTKAGSIINVSSVVGLIGNPGQTNYAASKAGMIGFSKALAKEVASRNIRVNCIAPGFVATNMTDALSEERKKLVTDQIPMGRFGTCEEIANCALFLASKQASYITGQVLVCDGGLAM